MVSRAAWPCWKPGPGCPPHSRRRAANPLPTARAALCGGRMGAAVRPQCPWFGRGDRTRAPQRRSGRTSVNQIVPFRQVGKTEPANRSGNSVSKASKPLFSANRSIRQRPRGLSLMPEAHRIIAAVFRLIEEPTTLPIQVAVMGLFCRRHPNIDRIQLGVCRGGAESQRGDSDDIPWGFVLIELFLRSSVAARSLA